jgi:hypothetical protein
MGFRCRSDVKVKVLLLCGAFLIATSGNAAAKVATYRLTVDGPGMASTGVIGEGRLLDRVARVLLFTSSEARTSRPETAGAPYVLTYRLGVSDEDGNRNEIINQALYPFASGGPVVFTAKRQEIDTTYGRVRFVHGWFIVPSRTLRTLERAGLPAMAPEPEAVSQLATERLRSSQLESIPWAWPWVLGMGALATAAGAFLQGRRRSPRSV